MGFYGFPGVSLNLRLHERLSMTKAIDMVKQMERI